MDIKRPAIVIRYPFIFCFLLLTSAVFSQANFTTVVDRTKVARNQLIQVEYVIENAKEVGDFDPPEFRNFIVVQGPIQSSGTSIINGNMTQYKALVFIMQPRTTGKLIIPGATAVIDGKRRQSEAVAIEVTKSQGSNPTSRRPLRFNLPEERVEADREFVLYPNESIVDKIRKNLFVRVEVSKKACYVNEPVIATYKLYSRVRSDSRVVKRPSYNGFSVYDMVDPDGGDNPSVETVNGKRYNVHIIRQSQLFPLQSGHFVLDPVEVENTVSFVKASSEQDTYLEEYYDPYAETVQHTLTIGSNPVDITVKPLPTAGQPRSFDGAVGRFSVTAALKYPLIKAGEANTLAVAIKGNGNLPMINAPAVTWPDKVEAFDPTAKENLHPEVAPLAGTKTFEYLFTPKDTGTVVIPPVAFSYFDPASQSYKTDSTHSFNLRVGPSDKKAKTTGGGIRPAIIPSSKNFWWWVAGGSLLTLVLVVSVVNRNKKHTKAAKAQVVPIVIEAPVKIDPLEKARRMMSVTNASLFIREVESVIWNEIREELKIPPVMLNQPQVIATLEKKAADASTIALFREIMHDCEYALYIPGQSPEDLRSILDKAERFLAKLNSLS